MGGVKPGIGMVAGDTTSEVVSRSERVNRKMPTGSPLVNTTGPSE